MTSEEARGDLTDEPVEYDNPAHRLHRILAAAAAQTDGSLSTRQLWSSVFDVRPKDTFAIYQRLVALGDLADEVEEAVRAVLPPVSHDRLLSWRTNARTVMTGSIDATWGNYRALLDNATLQSIGFCADRLDEESFNEQVIPETDLRGLASDVDELFNQVASGSLDPELQRVILRSLEEIRRAIAEYRIRGSAGLYEALARARGQARYHPQMNEEWQKGTPELKKYAAIIGKGESILHRLVRWWPWLRTPIRFYLGEGVGDFLALLPGPGDE